MLQVLCRVFKRAFKSGVLTIRHISRYIVNSDRGLADIVRFTAVKRLTSKQKDDDDAGNDALLASVVSVRHEQLNHATKWSRLSAVTESHMCITCHIFGCNV